MLSVSTGTPGEVVVGGEQKPFANCRNAAAMSDGKQLAKMIEQLVWSEWRKNRPVSCRFVSIPLKESYGMSADETAVAAAIEELAEENRIQIVYDIRWNGKRLFPPKVSLWPAGPVGPC